MYFFFLVGEAYLTLVPSPKRSPVQDLAAPASGVLGRRLRQRNPGLLQAGLELSKQNVSSPRSAQWVT